MPRKYTKAEVEEMIKDRIDQIDKQAERERIEREEYREAQRAYADEQVRLAVERKALLQRKHAAEIALLEAEVRHKNAQAALLEAQAASASSSAAPITAMVP